VVVFWLCFISGCFGQTDGFTIVTPNIFTLFRYSGQSKLFIVEVNDSYAINPYLMLLKGSHFEIGFDYGYMLSDIIPQLYSLFMQRVIGTGWEISTVEWFLDWQWNSYLSHQVPQDFFDELSGLRAASEATGVPNLDVYVTRIITLSNFPGDILSNIEQLLETESVMFKTELITFFQTIKFIETKNELFLFCCMGKPYRK